MRSNRISNVTHVDFGAEAGHEEQLILAYKAEVAELEEDKFDLQVRLDNSRRNLRKARQILGMILAYAVGSTTFPILQEITRVL